MTFDFRKLIKWSSEHSERKHQEEMVRIDKIKDEWPFSFTLAAGAPKPFQIKPLLESVGIEFYNEFYTFRFKELDDMDRALNAIKQIHLSVPTLDKGF